MNVYDFDGTIFPGDCAIGFAVWCMNRHPTLWFTYFPRAVKAFGKSSFFSIAAVWEYPKRPADPSAAAGLQPHQDTPGVQDNSIGSICAAEIS